jgi:hypothetical protein
LARAGDVASATVRRPAEKPRGRPCATAISHLEDKLAEVTGLALAAEAAGGKISRLTEKQDASLVATLHKVAEEAAETARRCESVGHWSVLQTMNESARNKDVRELVAWALPIQERHFQDALQGSRLLAAEQDPNEPA